MPCYKPIDGWHKIGGGVVFTPAGSNSIPLKIPCGQCIGCRTERKQEWALRLQHESRLHDSACFVTLTYAPEFLPRGSTLVKSHVQSFIKRLRSHLKYSGYPRRIRYFAVGEYGDQTNRPHYHLIIFGWRPTDGKLHSESGGNRLHTSGLLETLWGLGHCSFGECTPETCAYVSHYTVKKVTGDMAPHHYTRLTLDGQFVQVEAEFSLQSRRPGIGADFYKRATSDFRNHDNAILLGKKKKIPRYYDKLLQRENEQQLETIKAQRKSKARTHRANNTPERLRDREIVAQAKLKSQTRKAL